MIVWSYGGGVQTAAIAVLIREGALPKPDLTVIADTSRERKTTWAYLREVIQPYLDPIGITVEIASHAMAGFDMYAGNGDMLLPAWTEMGRLPTYCSGTWKRDVVENWMRLRGVQKCAVWIGFSLDEMHRCGKAHRAWAIPEYPLIDKRLYREQCKRLVQAAGLPPAPKSRCWMCPHQTPEEWQEVRDDPEEWAAAIWLDERIRAADERGGLFLHSSRVPLAIADLSVTDDLPLYRACQDAGCWT
jgi:hypothetical protein